jgi:hypothetical protein
VVTPNDKLYRHKISLSTLARRLSRAVATYSGWPVTNFRSRYQKSEPRQLGLAALTGEIREKSMVIFPKKVAAAVASGWPTDC